MDDSKPEESPDVNGAAELEQALVAVELKLDETFEAAEHRAGTEDEGAGLILEGVLDLIYDTFGSVLPYDRVGIAIVEDDGEIMQSRWACSEADSLTIGSGHAAPLADGAVDAVLAAGEPLIVNDLEAYLEEHPDSEPTRQVLDQGMRSCLTCPLTIAGKPIGMMVFSSTRPEAYGDDHKAAFGHIAEHLATILDRSRLYERLVDLNWQLRVACDALDYQATHDGLTRLLNRTAIIEAAECEMDRAQRQNKPISMVMCDIDDFSEINGVHGHLAGDVVLRAVAERLAGALRSYETVGRYGGDEFLITLYDCGEGEAPHAMQRLRTAVVGEAIATRKGEIAVSISLGGAVSVDATAELDDLVHAAGQALRDARESGPEGHKLRLVDGNQT